MSSTTISISLTDSQRWALEDLMQALSTQLHLTAAQRQAVCAVREALDQA